MEKLTDTELAMLISFILTLGDQNPRNMNNDTKALLKKLQDELDSRPRIKAEASPASESEKRIPRDYLGYQFHGQHVPAVHSLAEAHADRERMQAFKQQLHQQARDPEGEGGQP